MKLFTLQRQQFVPRPPSEVFLFFSRPENLELITPPWLGFRMLTPSPILMQKGAVIDYSLRTSGMKLQWRSLISEYNPPYMFADQQVKGPYALWLHLHTFTEADDGTIIKDEVHYALPLGPLGWIAQHLVVRKQLEDIFEHRSGAIEQLFGVEVRPINYATSNQVETIAKYK
jgi:ligand-binding SRPBCC domain-containing protein